MLHKKGVIIIIKTYLFIIDSFIIKIIKKEIPLKFYNWDESGGEYDKWNKLAMRRQTLTPLSQNIHSIRYS